ncbi:MAG TPA: ankyrin repeat domain-containing protein, partial [Dictyoglomaceae bacterium]|nr:ankyrin repeat domain-containing protein [Dictyoglomaceae bacterium]
MKKTLLGILMISFILSATVPVLGQENFFELVKTGTPEKVKEAIKAGADVNAKDTSYGMTLLMWAAENNQNPEVIKVLLEAGADVNAKDKDDRTPLI